MKPLLIGEAPGPNGDPEKPLEGKPAERLLECMGIAVEDPESAGETLRDLFAVRNLLDRPMERLEGGKGCEWPEEEAKELARRLALLVERGQSIVFLGKRVAQAFGLKMEWWTWRHAVAPIAGYPGLPGSFVAIPHPSGIVRLWNDPVNRVRAGTVLWQAVGRIDR